jgi:anti-anti-sigma factor
MDASLAIIINLPQSLGSREAKKLVRELKMQITDESPLVILDLSRVKKMDCAGLAGLLVCTQEIAKHDGAIQVRAISPEAATLLEMVRMDRLLQKFAPLPAQSPGFTIAPAYVAEEVKLEMVVQLPPSRLSALSMSRILTAQFVRRLLSLLNGVEAWKVEGNINAT